MDAERCRRLHLIYRAVREVATPVDLRHHHHRIVFLPLLTLQGLEGKLFSPVALTIVFALAASLLLSLTVIPVLGSLLLEAGSHGEPWLLRKALGVYAPLLRRALARAHRRRPRSASPRRCGWHLPLIGKAFMP